MGLFDWFSKKTACPDCGQKYAAKYPGVCLNKGCIRYNPNAIPVQESRPMTGNFDPGANRIEIHYRNFMNEEKTLVGDRTTIRMKGNHISLCMVPTGKRVSLAKDRIQNLPQLINSAPQHPTAKERQVLGYHTKNGTTSPLYESIRKKYPDWS